MIQLPVRDPCDLCLAVRDERWKIIDETDLVLTVINPRQFETGQCCVVTRRHVATLLDLSDQECGAVMVSRPGESRRRCWPRIARWAS